MICSFCKKELKVGEFKAVIGKQASDITGFFKIWAYSKYPTIIGAKEYCKSCFDKKFKIK